MDFSTATVCSTPSLTAKLIILICLFWPFIAASFLSRRGTSAGPIAATLVPLALSVGGAFIGLHNTLRGLAISGSRPGGAAAAAGVAESLTFLTTGAFFAMIVLIVAAIRRHRPFVDRVTAVLFSMLIVEVAGALYMGATLANGRWQFYSSLAGAGVAGVIAIIAAVWMFLTGRRRVSSRLLPYGLPVLAVLCAVTSVIVWRWVQHFIVIAKFG